ncbi:class I SAM-dependent methyltransferase [Streptomyces griseoviridis]
MTQFDELGDVYEEFSRHPFRRELEFPSVLDLLGDVSDLRVLDLGCGSGVYGRALARHGAGQVVGLDESDGMIGYARARESAAPLGVSYLAGSLPAELAGTFDLVLGVYVLPYATTYDELVGLCGTAAAALRPGGRFVTLPIHPDVRNSPDYYEPCGFRLYVHEPRRDGSPVELELHPGSGHDIDVTARYWGATTLEKALGEAGFGPVDWRRHHTGGAPSDVPPGFWEPYLRAPHAAILDTRKESVPS